MDRRLALKSIIAVSAAVALGATVLPVTARSQGLKELNFGIISTESSSNLKTIWVPFLADMEKTTGMKVNAFFAPDYAGIIEAMRFGKVQMAWFGNASAMQAVDRAEGEIFVQSVASDGAPGYWSLLLVHKDSTMNSLKDVVAAPGKLTFANGDPNSTSGFLVPSFYAWGQNNIDVRKHFTKTVSGNHEANALAVANKQVDIATCNSEAIDRLKLTAPDRAAQLKEIWRSPLIPSDPIVWRKDLADSDKAKIKSFFLSYGVPSAGKPAEKLAQETAVLKDLQWAPFRESSNRQLIPIRQLALYRDKIKLEGDANMAADEKAKRISEIDAKLADLNRQAGT